MQNLTLGDLVAIKKIIDTACVRGAFRAEEMSEVGRVYDNLSSFIQNLLDQAQTQGETND